MGDVLENMNGQLNALLAEIDEFLGVDFAPKRSVRTACSIETKPTGAEESEKQAEPGTHVKLEETVRDDEGRDVAAMLASIRAEHDAKCPHCTHTRDYTQTVFGEGHPQAELMFVGEAPGEEEDRTGRPFVGRAGQKLNDILKAMGMKREEVYIANILKARPPGNRTPLPLEVERCAPYLRMQIRAIRPRVMVALGGPATKFLLKTEKGITALRGMWGEYEDGELVVPVMPTFHPAYLLRSYTVENRQKVWSDMQAVLERLRS